MAAEVVAIATHVIEEVGMMEVALLRDVEVRAVGNGVLVLSELVKVSALAEHVDDIDLGAGCEELELGGGVLVDGRKRAEVGDHIALAKLLRVRTALASPTNVLSHMR